MNENLKYYLSYTVAYGIVLLIGELMFRGKRAGPAWTRNFSHLFAGLISLPYPWLFTSHWWVLALAVQSCLFLTSTRMLKMLPSHHQVAQRSLGSYLFFVSIYLCYLASFKSGQKEMFVIPILVLSISDVSAAWVGRSSGKFSSFRKKWPGPESKTLAGSAGFFLSALLILYLSFYFYMDHSFTRSFLLATAISLLSATIEAISPYGTDNFFIPLSVLLFIHLGGIM